MLIKLSTHTTAWDATYSDDTPAPTGVYVWQAYVQTLEGNSVLAGDITVIR